MDLDYIPYPGDDHCVDCVLYSHEDQCCHAANAEECAQVNGLLDGDVT